MKKAPITRAEVASIVLSLTAIAISIWAVQESRNAALLTRRIEVKNAAISTIEDLRRTYSGALCDLRATGTKTKEAETSFSNAKNMLDEVRDISVSMHRANHGFLDVLEARLDAMAIAGEQLKDEQLEFRAALSASELDRVDKVCAIRF